MDPTIVSALAGLVGAIIGATTSVVASWIAQRGQALASSRNRAIGQREELYREFIENAVECYADALQHDQPDVGAIVRLLGKIDLMRLHSSQTVIDAAEEVRAQILSTYHDPNKDLDEIGDLIRSGSINLLGTFSSTSRAELESLKIAGLP